MSTLAPVQPTVSSPPSPTVHRITVDEYERIIAAGALDDPSTIELIDGYMVDKMGKSAEHGYTTKKLLRALDSRLPSGWTWRAEQPVRIPSYDEPEPDVTVVRGADEDYRHLIPGPDDVCLLIEVSLTTLGQDRGEKRSAYARGRIPVYWIVNLVDRLVEVYSRPAKGTYKSQKEYKPGEQVPIAIDGQPLQSIAVDDILP